MRLKGLEQLTLLTKPNACTLGRPLLDPLQEGLLAGPPAFQFYAADWLAGTQLLSAAARGAYMTMLATSWERGAIPNTPTALYRAMSLAPSDPPFEDLWCELQPKWTLTKDGWKNDRLERIRTSQDDFRKLAAKAGRASGRKRRKLAVERITNERSTDRPTEHERIANSPISDLRSPISDLRSPISDLRSPISDLRSPIPDLQSSAKIKSVRRAARSAPEPPAFSAFYARYPRRVDRADALRAWVKLDPDVVTVAAINAALDWQIHQPGWKEQKGKFIPYPASWLNGRRFEDEPFEVSSEESPNAAGFARVLGRLHGNRR